MDGYPCRSCIKTVNSCYYHNKIVGCVCENYKPKEKQMNRVIFESEGEFKNFVLDVFKPINPYSVINLAKDKGYIRKSVVEEAEEMYEEFKTRVIKGQEYYEEMCRLEELAVKLHEALQYLKDENEKYKPAIDNAKAEVKK